MIDNWYYSIHNLEIHVFGDRYCYLPKEADDTLKQDIKISLSKNFMGFKTHKEANDVLNNLPSKKEQDSPYLNLLNEIIHSIWSSKQKLYGKIENLELKKESAITLGVLSTLKRLENSYESIIFLIKNHFYFEATAINRLIFEQLNYCFNLTHLTQSEYESLSRSQQKKKLNPTNIKNLKEFLTTYNLGRFYSDLSELAHIDIKRINEYLIEDEEKDGYLIIRKDIIQSILMALYLYRNIDIHGIVLEYFLSTHNNENELTFIEKENGKLKLNSNRPSRKTVNDFSEKYRKLIENVDLHPQVIRENQNFKVENDDLPF